jgi:hypothetical protein
MEAPFGRVTIVGTIVGVVFLMQGLVVDMKCPVQEPVLAMPSVAGDGLLFHVV